MSSGGQAILIEEKGSNGTKFAMPIQNGGTFETDAGEFRTVGILQRLPTFPVMTGPGFDGRQSRFSPDNEFVFRARVTPTAGGNTVDGIFVVTIEEQPEKCDVKVSQKKGNLTLTSKDKGCRVVVDVSRTGSVEVRADDPNTTINGKSDPFTGTVVRNMKMVFRGGGTTVHVQGGGLPDKFPVTGSIAFTGGPALDVVDLDGLAISGNVTLRMGGSGEGDQVRLQEVDVAGNLKCFAGTGETGFEFGGGSVGKNAVVTGGGNQSRIIFERAPVGGNLTLKFDSGDGEKLIDIEDSSVGPQRQVQQQGREGDGEVLREHRRGREVRRLLRPGRL